MKLHAELAVGAVVFAATFYVVAPVRSSKNKATSTSFAVVDATPASLTPFLSVSQSRSIALVVTGTPVDTAASTEARNEMSALHNAVLAASGHPNGVVDCLHGVELASSMRLRFAIDVIATTNLATTGAWRFVEIVDGQQLPETFAACAARALGGNLRVTPPLGLAFPTFRGELTTLYRTPEPTSADNVQAVEGVDSTNR